MTWKADWPQIFMLRGKPALLGPNRILRFLPDPLSIKKQAQTARTDWGLGVIPQIGPGQFP
jgi:hypothetical protein